MENDADLCARFPQANTLEYGLLTLNLAREMARIIDRVGEALIDQAILR